MRHRRRAGTYMPRTTIRDTDLSYLALGLLTYLLDRPRNWQVRGDALAAERDDPEGRVMKALARLREKGYYRLERRRLLSGKFAMGTAVSEDPVEEWIADNAEFGGKPVDLVQQPDGSFLVLHKDGSMTSDGFEDLEDFGDELEEYDEDEGDPDAYSRLWDNPEPEDAVPVQPEPQKPDPGQPDPGSRGPFRSTEKKNREESSGSFASAQKPAGSAQQPSLLGDDIPPAPAAETPKKRRNTTKERTPEEQARFDQADEIARGWWARCDVLGIPNIKRSNSGVTGFVGFRAMIERTLAADCDVNEIKWALEDLRDPFPSTPRLTNAIGRRRGAVPQQSGYGKPNTRVHIDNVPQAERDFAAAAFGDTPKNGVSW
ncbi:hypothetical protein GCM10022252_76060 [Streptosporangium oxazolinicum]|uniref:Uncharacterized protein n=2 Tax=Streptosporangium oxazolinicum TaxID=909287 RepID=A0ABP8BLI0_9ACTN